MSLADAIRTVQQADAALMAAGPSPFPLPISGLEAVVVGALEGLERGDWWVPGLRERAGAVLRGVGTDRLIDGFRGARPYKMAPPTASPATRALHAVGLAHGSGRPTLVHLGVGSVADGAFAEALDLAARHGAPVIFLVTVWPLGDEAPLGPQAATRPEALARAWELPITEVDGTRAHAVREAVARAREAGGPHVLVATLTPGADPVARADA